MCYRTLIHLIYARVRNAQKATSVMYLSCVLDIVQYLTLCVVDDQPGQPVILL